MLHGLVKQDVMLFVSSIFFLYIGRERNSDSFRVVFSLFTLNPLEMQFQICSQDSTATEINKKEAYTSKMKRLERCGPWFLMRREIS